MLRNYDLKAMQLQLTDYPRAGGRDNSELEIAASILDKLNKDCHRDQIETMKVMDILRTLFSEGSLSQSRKIQRGLNLKLSESNKYPAVAFIRGSFESSPPITTWHILILVDIHAMIK